MTYTVLLREEAELDPEAGAPGLGVLSPASVRAGRRPIPDG
jgi:hypothetical protein